MGIIKAAMTAGGSVLGDQWLEYIYCDALPNNVLLKKGQKRTGEGSSNNGSDNIITKGSRIAVNEGQFMLIVEDGKIVDFTAEPGAYTYDSSTEPTMLYGGFGKGLLESFKKFGKRFQTGGDTAHDQRVYFINTKEITQNKFGTAQPIPLRDSEFGITVDIKCYGEYVYKIIDPLAFYGSLCGNVANEFTTSQIDSQFLSDFMAALQPALGAVAAQKISYDMLPGATPQVSTAVAEQLKNTWGATNGINVTRVSIASVTPTADSAEMIKAAQKDRLYAMNTGMQGARANAAASEALVGAANNANGAMNGFVGVGMMNQGGTMFGANMSAQSQNHVNATGMISPENPCKAPGPAVKTEVKDEPIPVKAEGKKCPNCGAEALGKFCAECGTKIPEEVKKRFCTNCGTEATGKFCTECGTKIGE